MKKRILISIAFLFPLLLAAQNSAVDKLFKKYSGKDGFTSVMFSKNLFKLAADIEPDDPEINELLDNLTSIKILSMDKGYKIPGVNFYDEIMKDLNAKDYEELMEVKEKDQNVKFLVKEYDGRINELLLIVGGNDNALISISGLINPKTISKISKSMRGTGLEHLEKLEEKE